VMADASEDPEDIVRLAGRMADGWDIVGGSRYMRGGRIVGNTLKQRVSRAYSVLMRMVGGPPIHDISNAFKLYSREVLASLDLISDSFDLSVELTLKAYLAGFRITEIPTVWTNRAIGQSHFRLLNELRNYGRWLLIAATKRPSSVAGKSH
jgi:dolichol-phosphate mannosyltransferase